METAIVSLICIALVILGGMTMSQGFLTSADTTSEALEELGQSSESIMRTELTPQTANAIGSTGRLTVNLENSGQTKLTNFEKWDLIVQYYDSDDTYYTKWLPFTDSTLASNQWTVNGIYLNEKPESFEPNILNPGETIELEAKLNPAAGVNTTNLVVIATPNGIPASIDFTREW